MTWARRLAGAQRPAPSAGSARPDPRPGRFGGRLVRLLPALALLLGALSPFAATTAEARTVVDLVHNHDRTIGVSGANGYSNAHALTAGSRSEGYVSSSTASRRS